MNNQLVTTQFYERDLKDDRNDGLLLQIVHARQLTTRAELAEIAHLSPSTVSTVIRRLIRNGYVKEIGTSPSNGGRPAVQITIRPETRFAIGTEFSLHRIKVAVTDLNGSVKHSYEADPPALDADSITQRLIELIKHALVDI